MPRQKYGGSLIHSSRDEHGLLEVVDDGFFRSLHFGSEPRQSSMDIYNPVRLALSYTRALTCALLFRAEPPERVLTLGLGGGSLVKFLLHHFPRCRVDAVELREQVVKLAHGYFLLPEDPRLRIFVEDAGRFVRRSGPGQGGYDLILIDAYVHNGMAGSVAGLSFFRDCRMLLSTDGVLATNLWSADSLRLEDTLQEIADNFDDRVFRLPLAGKENVAAIAPNAPTPRQGRNLKQRAHHYEQLLDVEYPNFLRALKKANPGKI